MDHYPQDIQQYNNDPRSPLYDDSRDDAVAAIAIDIEKALFNGEEYEKITQADVIEHLDDDSFNDDIWAVIWMLMNPRAKLIEFPALVEKVRVSIKARITELADEELDRQVADRDEP